MKIKKNLSDQDMFKGCKEELTFETAIQEEETARPKTTGKKSPTTANSEFLTPELQEKIGKALLELKVKLFNAGVVDYELKVTIEDNKIILTPKPVKKPQKIYR
jgi:hypothetical protein